MGILADQILDWGIVAIISIGGTYIGIIFRLQKKYQTLISQQIYETAQKIIHEAIDDKMRKIERKMMFMSVMCGRVWKHIGIPDDEIENIRRSCEVNKIE